MEFKQDKLRESLSYYCNLRGITIHRLAKMCDIRSINLYRGIKGKINLNLTLQNASKIAKALDITINELYYGNNIDVNSPAGEIKKE